MIKFYVIFDSYYFNTLAKPDTPPGAACSAPSSPAIISAPPFSGGGATICSCCGTALGSTSSAGCCWGWPVFSATHPEIWLVNPENMDMLSKQTSTTPQNSNKLFFFFEKYKNVFLCDAVCVLLLLPAPN
jgi:hypothetical protein